MKNLRMKLWLGFGGMLAILTAVSVLGIVVITLYSQAIERVLRENYRSVVYGQRMLDALDQLTTDAQAVVFGGSAGSGANASGQAGARAEFEENLALESRNITLPGEQEAADETAARWRGFVEQLDKTMGPGVSAPERLASYPALLAREGEVRAAAEAIVAMNEENMATVNGHAEKWASGARMALLLFLGAGLGLGMVLIVLAGRWILEPLRTFIRSAREIEAGNLNLVVPVKTSDEVGQLAEAFNSMAVKLRAYRETDQAKLLRTQQTTQLAIDSLPDGVAVVNPDGVIELANGAAVRLFNLQPPATVQQSGQRWLVDLFHAVRDEQRATEAEGYQNALQVFDDGVEKYFLPQGVPIKDGVGRLIGITVVLIDITRLRQIDEIKSSLVSTVSHELRTPLTSIRLANHLLLSDRIGTLTPKQAEVVMESRQNADRLQRIIENLLDMSRIEAGQSVLETEAMSPYEMASQAVDEARGAAQEKGVELRVNVPVELPRVRADRHRMNHVLMNLLNNAIRYTPAGGEVTVSATSGKGMVEFSVSDTGPGIPSAYKPRVFERFFRAPGQHSQGVGLGLAIAKEIVQAHGGSMSVDGSSEGGATFRFTLPMETSQAEAAV